MTSGDTGGVVNLSPCREADAYRRMSNDSRKQGRTIDEFFSPQTRVFNPGSRTSAGRGRMRNMGDDIGKEREAE